MERKEFLRCCGAGTLGAMASALGAPPCAAGVEHSCEQRVGFAERWAARFMTVLDQGLDEPTRRRLMEANGKACFEGWLENSGTVIERVAFEDWRERIAASGPREDIRVEGRVIHFQYMRNTKGDAAPEGFCLCDLMESRPAGVSPTYCHCSVGYVRELFTRRFGRPVEVTLLDSVLRGGRRCRFRIDVP